MLANDHVAYIRIAMNDPVSCEGGHTTRFPQ